MNQPGAGVLVAASPVTQPCRTPGAAIPEIDYTSSMTVEGVPFVRLDAAETMRRWPQWRLDDGTDAGSGLRGRSRARTPRCAGPPGCRPRLQVRIRTGRITAELVADGATPSAAELAAFGIDRAALRSSSSARTYLV